MSIVYFLFVVFVALVHASMENDCCTCSTNQQVNKAAETNKTVVYTRWGKMTCPSNAELVYTGFVGGSHYTHPGSASEYLCLPSDPQWGIYKDGLDGYKALVYGAEYETYTYNENFAGMHDHDVPCAVCLVHNRSVVRMFPARKTCYDGWKLEYQGYLMATYYKHAGASKYTCVDHHPDALHAGRSNMDGKLFYFVEAVCGSLKCPPYVNGRELVCAVCSRE
ncbi:uncharacterized protein LOC111107576 isoform X2 [Crassostrea virginica]